MKTGSADGLRSACFFIVFQILLGGKSVRLSIRLSLTTFLLVRKSVQSQLIFNTLVNRKCIHLTKLSLIPLNMNL